MPARVASQYRYRGGRPRTGVAGDVDDVVVDLLARGWRVEQSTPAERTAMVAKLIRRRLSTSQIARRTGFSSRTVDRHRARLRSTAAGVPS